MALSMTPAAAARVDERLKARGKGIGLRIGIQKTGCSGYAYVVNYADDIQDGDAVFESEGLKIVVDREHLEFLDGTQVDFVKQGLNEAFQFANPNVAGECGCGESFSV
ncbi:MAG: iron-sulfur cluster assembly accessory protein [Pseudomonadota bacterium]